MANLKRKSAPKNNAKTALKTTGKNEVVKNDVEAVKNAWSVIFGGVDSEYIIQITDKQKIVISINKNEETGEKLLDIRTWVKTAKYEGVTSKGISIPLKEVGFLSLLLEEINKLRNEGEFD